MIPLLIAGHGSADADGAADFLRLADRVAGRLDVPVAGGFIELSPPPLSDAVATLVDGGVRRLAAVPLMLVAAGHAKGDIPAALARERARHTGLIVHYGRPLGPHPTVLALLPRGSAWQMYAGLIGSGFLLQGTIPILISYSQRLLPRGRRLAASLTLGASWGVGGVLVAGLKLLFPSSEHLPGMLWTMVPFALASSACAALLPRSATLLYSHQILAAPVRPEAESGMAPL